jgi:hypothetical protein
MDSQAEQASARLLAPSADALGSVKVSPVIHALKKDIIASYFPDCCRITFANLLVGARLPSTAPSTGSQYFQFTFQNLISIGAF